MGTVSVVAGTIQAYAWGRVNALAAWAPAAADGPHAELWFGAHPNGPSPLLAGPAVGPEQAPLLVKLLAAAAPLSIQVHPGIEGIAVLSASPETADLLADDGVKSEVLIAVEPFAVLAGLRDADDAARLLAAGLGLAHPAVTALLSGDRIEAIRQVFGGESDGAVEVDARAMLAALTDVERDVMQRVVAVYEGDPGLPVAFMLQPRVLQPGQAMFVEAGCLHAYVDGFGVEVMTASDNVLRLGLTPKRVAVEPALSIVRADLQPTVVDDCAAPVQVPHIPFTVQRVADAEVAVDVPGALLLCVEGSAEADCGAAVTMGQAALLHEGCCVWRVRGLSYVARPLNDG
ncbi:MAG: hypothetical protein KGP01_00030 [Actinomycetales bacterium]|nr:hypothetical protein [Actinomycetales bacterium]